MARKGRTSRTITNGIKWNLANGTWIVDLWNGTVTNARTGKQLGAVNSSGYKVARGRDGILYYVHQIIAIAGGIDIVDKVIDHCNRDRLDNRLINLRAVEPRENIRNRGGKFAKC
ncbi:MAG: zinc-binding loop region of homing endonuclease [Bacteriophage sp.]|nr:MAG: zinc-binding loop region of homing endonuclease [Bacteriophage sp.]